MKGYKINIIRHGQTKANDEGRYIGVTDYPLSMSGLEELTKKSQEYDYGKISKVYSSPLCRATQTADVLYPNSQLVVVDDLREMDFGVFEGLRADELINLDSYKSWLKGGADNPPPNGESLHDMITRCYNAIDSIILDIMKNNIPNSAIITHSGIIMNLLSCFGLPKRKPLDYTCDVGEGFEIYVTAMMWQRDGIFEILGRVPSEELGFRSED